MTKRGWSLPDDYPLWLKVERMATVIVYALLVSGAIVAGAGLALERHVEPAPDMPDQFRVNPEGSQP